MPAYYNENDKYCAAWLRNLIAAGHIAAGDVDERSIVDVRPDDLRPYRQCHFFAGIGGWSYALRLAGWADVRFVWSGSCPCQPFSSAGRGKAADDERHLWPHWFELIRAIRPAIVIGEQVESAIGWGWLDLVCSDLGAEGYTVRSAVLPACSVGAPHLRARLWFVAHTDQGRGGRDSGAIFGAEGSAGRQMRSVADGAQSGGAAHGMADDDAGRCEVERTARLRLRSSGHDADGRGADGELADAGRERCERRKSAGPTAGGGRRSADAGGSCSDDMADAAIAGWDAQSQRHAGTDGRPAEESGRLRDAGDLGDASEPRLPARERAQLSGAQRLDQGRAAQQSGGSFWADCVWLPCSDGKARPTQSGLQPLAHGVPARVGKLRAAGNAIVPQAGAAFIRAVMEAIDDEQKADRISP